jgi:hypothetical protein
VPRDIGQVSTEEVSRGHDIQEIAADRAARHRNAIELEIGCLFRNRRYKFSLDLRGEADLCMGSEEAVALHSEKVDLE